MSAITLNDWRTMTAADFDRMEAEAMDRNPRGFSRLFADLAPEAVELDRIAEEMMGAMDAQRWEPF